MAIEARKTKSKIVVQFISKIKRAKKPYDITLHDIIIL